MAIWSGELVGNCEGLIVFFTRLIQTVEEFKATQQKEHSEFTEGCEKQISEQTSIASTKQAEIISENDKLNVFNSAAEKFASLAEVALQSKAEVGDRQRNEFFFNSKNYISTSDSFKFHSLFRFNKI